MIEIQQKHLSNGQCQIIIPIHLTPKSGQDAFIPYTPDMDAVRVRIRAVPEGGKANEALIKFLSKQWRIPKTSIEIISGHQSRHKRIALSITKNQQQMLISEMASTIGLQGIEGSFTFKNN